MFEEVLKPRKQFLRPALRRMPISSKTRAPGGGNFPQTYSHCWLINSAVRLSRTMVGGHSEGAACPIRIFFRNSDEALYRLPPSVPVPEHVKVIAWAYLGRTHSEKTNRGKESAAGSPSPACHGAAR